MGPKGVTSKLAISTAALTVAVLLRTEKMMESAYRSKAAHPEGPHTCPIANHAQTILNNYLAQRTIVAPSLRPQLAACQLAAPRRRGTRRGAQLVGARAGPCPFSPPWHRFPELDGKAFAMIHHRRSITTKESCRHRGYE